MSDEVVKGIRLFIGKKRSSSSTYIVLSIVELRRIINKVPRTR